MISKIEKIKNIGNFEDYSARGNVSLKRMNLIYAENGSGKTTLAQILQSLASDDESIIALHKRIGALGPSEVSIKGDIPSPFVFNGSRWNRSIPEISVFDAHFVDNNIYSGFDISADHHKSLYQFVVGDTGVSFVKKIERVKELISECNTELGSYANLISALTHYDNYEEICSLQPEENIDEQIGNKEEELKIAKGQAQIATYSVPEEIRNEDFGLDFNAIKSSYEQSVEIIGNDYIELVKEHLQHLKTAGMTNASQWVFEGSQTDFEGKCPYCGQSLAGLELIDGYNQYFSEQYIEASQNAIGIKVQLDSVNIDTFVLRLNNQYRQIVSSIEFWDKIIPGKQELPSLDLESLGLSRLLNHFKEEAEKKVSNPLLAVSVEPLDAFMLALKQVEDQIEQINKYVRDYSREIASVKSKIRPVADLEKELESLQIIKSRFENPLKEHCTNYLILKHQLERLKRINIDLQKRQKAASVLLFQQYGYKINDYLKNVFMTPFQITNVKDVYKGAAKVPNLDYTLSFNGTPIDQGDGGASNTSFKNVLSEGDKNTIAFSFFLAKLVSDPGLANRVVVFDDPLTSLDTNRRNTTIDQLMWLSGQCKQVIVLSHNLHFLIDLNARKFPASEKVVLQIVNRKGSSSIQEYDLKTEWVDRYKRAILTMNDFVDNPDPSKQEDAIDGIRLSLETFLKLKFCQYIPNPNLTLGKLIEHLNSTPCQYANRDKASVTTRLMNLNEISWRAHHGTIDEMAVYSERQLTMSEAQNYVRMALDTLMNEL